MLTMIYGPSGSGKTSLLRILAEQYGWNIVRKYATRSLRKDDKTVLYVPPYQFNALDSSGALYAPREIYGHKKADFAVDIAAALSTTAKVPWGLEQIIEFSPLYAKISCKNVLLLPENADQLIEQLTRSHRLSRIPSALKSYTLHKDAIDSCQLQDNWLCLINYDNSLYEIASRVHLWSTAH